jgi:hypothetical protein
MQPTNNKSLFHTMCGLIDKIEKNQITNVQADLIIKAAGKCHDFMNLELKRVKVLHEIGKKDTAFREIELTNPDA